MTGILHRAAGQRTRRAALALLAPALLTVALPASQNLPDQPSRQEAGEVVANLAAGRAAVLVAKNGIAVATAQSQIEPETLPPLIVPLTSLRVAVLLGPAEWVWPDSGRTPLRLDVELRRRASFIRPMASQDSDTAATDIESAGLGFLEPLRHAAGLLHGPLHLQPNELFVEMLLVDYAPNYGPEVWSLRYRAEQELLRDDFYSTTVQRPEYVQLYPPDKGQPKTLIESSYPPHDPAEPPILDLLKAGDSRLAAFRNADPGMGRAAELLLRGESDKIKIDDGLELLRAAFQTVTPRGAKEMILVITEQEGMKWVLGGSELAPLTPEQKKELESAPPSLRKKPGPR